MRGAPLLEFEIVLEEERISVVVLNGFFAEIFWRLCGLSFLFLPKDKMDFCICTRLNMEIYNDNITVLISNDEFK